MKRSILLLVALVLITISGTAEINYFNESWDNIKAKAAAEHKFIFIDCYTDWCGWCKVMDKETMVDPTIISLINDNFIAVKMDMEKGEGIQLSMKYHVTGFPSFLFFSPEGAYTGHSVGYQKSDEFMKLLKGVIDKTKTFSAPGFSNSLESDYPEFYTNAFAGNGKRTFPKQEEVTAFLDQQKDLLNEVSWAVIARFPLNEKHTKLFLDNVVKYRQLYGKVTVDDKLNSIIGNMLTEATKKKDDKAFAAVLAMIDKYITDDPQGSKIYCSISYYKGTENWNKYAEAAGKYIQKNGYGNTSYINGICWDLYEKCNDNKQLQLGCSWMKEVIKKEPTYPYLDTYASLLYKTKQMADAKLYAEKAIATGKKDGSDVKSTEELLQKIQGTKKSK